MLSEIDALIMSLNKPFLRSFCVPVHLSLTVNGYNRSSRVYVGDSLKLELRIFYHVLIGVHKIDVKAKSVVTVNYEVVSKEVPRFTDIHNVLLFRVSYNKLLFGGFLVIEQKISSIVNESNSS